MNAAEINKIQDDYNRITKAIERAIQDDKMLVLEADRWVAHLCDDDAVANFDVNVNDEMVYVSFWVYTQMTGGSYEYPEAEIPLDTLNKYL